MSDDYQEKLAAWKTGVGLDKVDLSNPDEMRMIAEDHVSKKETWCFGCDEKMPVSQMHLITRRIDPYIQMFEGTGDFIPKKTALECARNASKNSIKEKFNMITLTDPITEAPSDWVHEQREYFIKFFPVGTKFTVDDLHNAFSEPAEKNDWGSLVALLKEQGRIVQTGMAKSKRKTRNGAEVKAWEVVK